MVTSCVFVAGTLMVSLLGASSPPGQRPSPQSHGPVIKTLAVADSFSPPKPKKRRPPGARSTQSEPPPSPRSTETESEADDSPPPPRRQAPAAAPVRAAIPTSDYREEAKEADDDEEENPQLRKKTVRKRMVRQEPEEEEEEEEEANGGEKLSGNNFPVILPRLIAFHAAAAAIGRSFGYNTALQRETTFPRIGLALSLESFPLVRISRDWWTRIGVGGSFSREIGTAALVQQSPGAINGASVGFPVVQQRWSFDLRYALALGPRVLLVPAIGVGFNTFDLQNRTPTPPSQCANVTATAVPCLADVDTSYLEGDVHLRAAILPQIGLRLSGGYFVGLKVSKGLGQIGQERTAIMSGFHVEPGADLMVTDWMAIRIAVPFIRYAYQFGGGTTGAYSSATETYYGATVGAIVFLP